MALIETIKIVDLLISFIEEQRPVYNSIIDRFFEGRMLNLFVGRRPTFPASSLPAVEIEMASETIGWHSCRVQENNPTLEIDITTDNSAPEQAARLESALVTLTTRILAAPGHLRADIQGTNAWMYDSLPNNVTYGHMGQGRMRVATISWTGKNLEYLKNKLFKPALWIRGPAHPVNP